MVGALVLAGCGAGERPPGDLPVRLLDEVGRVRIDSTLDLGDARAVRERTHRRFEAIAGDRLDGFHSAADERVRRVISGAAAAPGAAEPAVRVSDGAAGIRVDGPAALWRPLDPPPGSDARVSHAIAVRLAVDEGSDLRLCLLRVEDESADLGAPDLVSPLQHGRAPDTVELRPDGPADASGVVTYRAVHRWVDRYRYVLGLVVRAGGARLVDVERSLPTALGTVLEETAPRPGGSPWVRRVARGGDRRESLVLLAPGTACWPIEVPESGARLGLAVGHVDPEEEAGIEISVEIRADGRSRTRAGSSLVNDGGPLARWTSVTVDLDEWAGSAVEIVLAASTEAAEPVAVAFANPIVVARREPSTPRPPDVLLVSLDTVRADRVSAYGYSRDTTPALAALAERSAVFTQAIAPAPWTLPSHVTILSGQLPDRHGVRHTSQRIDPSTVPMLARELRARGYRTVAVTGGGYVAPDFGFGEGFEEYRTADPAPPLHLGSDVAMRMSAESRRRIDEVLAEPRDRPVFLFAHTYVAHEYHAEVDDLVAVGVPRDEAEALPQDRRWTSLRKRLRTTDDPARFADELAVMSRRYDAALRAADRLVERVLTASRALERPDETLVVVLSDHGEELGEHGDFGHAHDLHEELLRVPLLFFGRGVGAGRHDAVVSLADVAPTVRDLLGLDPLAELTDGRSLRPAFAGGPFAGEPALAVSGTPTRQEKHALRGERWKLKVERRPQGNDRVFLFDLAESGEAVDVSGGEVERTKQIANRLEARVAALRRLASSTGTAEISPEREEELRALGYLGN
ncbi:MAG: sulfatase-like hydrolase/transferase [Planctomycetota bacterium JB042]